MEINKTKHKYSDRLIPKSAIKKFKSNALNYLINRDDLLKTFDENEFEPEIEEFTTTYLEDNLRTIL